MSTNHTVPIQSLKTFADKIIDYAGLFPPASLDMGQAFHNFIFYRQGNYKWMLNKFIIPAKRLGELTDVMNEMKIEDSLIPFSILGSGGNSAREFSENTAQDIKSIVEFEKHHGKLVSIDAFEVRLPKDVLEKEDNKEMHDLMITLSDDLNKSLGVNIPVFYEAPILPDFDAVIIRVVESIAGLSNGSGFKLRTGGTDAAAFPDPHQVALAIMTCAEFIVPMKCTAGLHHPIRHFNDSVSSYMHGFLNVFGAGVFAYIENLDEEELLEVLNDEDPYEFVFKEESIEWNEIELSIAEIKEAREKFIISYGSCSFDEPIDDLKMMELL